MCPRNTCYFRVDIMTGHLWLVLCVVYMSLVDPSGATYDLCTDDETGAYLACQPSSSDIIWDQTFKLSVAPETATCGTPASTYRRLGNLNGPFQTCDANSRNLSHPPSNMVDTDSASWWQSVSQTQNSNDLQMNITLSFNKTFLIAGDFVITFNSGRPEKMVLEKSTDNGLTWTALQFYARDCKSFGGQLTPGSNVSADNPTAVTCTNRYVETVTRPPAGQKLRFAVDERFLLFLGPDLINFESFYSALENKMLNFLKFTDLRMRLIQPASDGRQNFDMYYYAIADIQASVWCFCNMHAGYCNYTETGVVCDCKHNTMGKDCDSCLPLYNDRPWQPGSYQPYESGTANECKKCECNEHAVSCVYNSTYGRGICQFCQHNTQGFHCQLCSPNFYPNLTVPLSDINRCVACHCDPLGAQENRTDCAQAESATEIIGQCSCKPLISGQRCDQCVPGFYGLKTGPTPGNCTACNCNTDGTVGQSNTCQQTSGQCTCKNNTVGRDCGSCDDGYFSFPTGSPERDCLVCSCDKGGSLDSLCDKGSGQCNCRSNITGHKCNQVTEGTYVPMIDSLTLEPQSGGCAITSDLYRSEAQFDGPGFALCDLDSGNVTLTMEPITGAMQQKDLEWPYLVAVRYSRNSTASNSSITGTIRVQVTGNTQEDLSPLLATLGQNLDSRCPQPVGRSSQVTLSFTPGFLKASTPESGNLTLDARCHYSVTLELHQNMNSDLTRSNETNSTSAPAFRKRRAIYPASAIMIDSVMLLPGLSNNDMSRQFQVYSQSENQTEMWRMYHSCIQQVAALSSHQAALDQSPCKDLFFSLGAELYNGTRDCGCQPKGAVLPLTCQSLGGQCQCKPGVTGRTCSVCMPGYFNFSSSGCTPCSCHPQGAKNGACNMTTGQCLCWPNVSLLSNAPRDTSNSTENVTSNTDGTCSSCLRGYYGLSSGAGCQACGCNQQGSLGQQCSEVGQCPCRDSVTGLKCDFCKDGFFGFSSTGCSPCNCSVSGSTTSNCNLTTGVCTCKTNTQGAKCMDCKPGFFSMEFYNPDGCQPCFCYGHGENCTSAAGFKIKLLQLVNLTSSVHQEPLQGDFHTSYGLNITMRLSAGHFLDLYNDTLISVTGNGKTIKHRAKNGTFLVPGEVVHYVVKLLEENWHLEESLQTLSALDIIEILTNVTHIDHISRSSQGEAINVTFVGLESVEKMMTSAAASGSSVPDASVSSVEQCVCRPADHVEGLSCERCATGYMRENLTLSSSYESCIPCNCQGRGVTDPPECDELTGKCLNCRNGTMGDSCEKCAQHVAGAECDNCTDQYWGLQEDGCRACNCSSPGSIDPVCDKKSGQCSCASHVVGRTCSECEENYNRLTQAGCAKCDECYTLLVMEIVPLRDVVANISSDVNLLVGVTVSPGTFTAQLRSAVLQAEQLSNFLMSAEASSSNMSLQLQSFQVTLIWVNSNMAKTENMTADIDQGLSKANTFIKLASSHRISMEAAMKTIYADIVSLQASNNDLGQLTISLNSVENYLQSLAANSTSNLEIIGYLTGLNQTVLRAKILTDELSQKSHDALTIDQNSTRTLLVLESLIFSLLSETSKTSSSVHNLASDNAVIRSTLMREQDTLIQLMDNVIDYVTIAGRTASAQSLTMSLQTQVIAETSFFTPLHIKTLQSETLLDSLTNKTQSLGSEASLLLWRSDGAHQQSSVIQKEADLLIMSAQAILATSINFSAQAGEIQRQANTSLNQLTLQSQQSQDLVDEAVNLTYSVMSLKQNTSVARVTSQQTLQIIQEKQQKLQTVSEQGEKLQKRLVSVQDLSEGYYKTVNDTRAFSLTPAQELCLNLSTSISEFKDKHALAESVTSEATHQLSNVTQRASQTLAQLKNITNVDIGSIQALLDQVLLAQTNFAYEDLKTVVSKLQTIKNIQQAEIDRLNSLKDVLRDRIESLKLLLQQVVSA